MPLGTVVFVAGIVFATICGLGSGLCRQILPDDVQRKSAVEEKDKVPWSPFGFGEIVRLHERYYLIHLP